MTQRWLALLIALVSGAVSAAEAPRWSTEIRGGAYEPDIDGWKEHYGDSRIDYLAIELGYLPFRFLELGLEGGRMHERGVGFLPNNSSYDGSPVTSEFFPLHLFVNLRVKFFESQWIVPFIGGGYTHMYYRQEIENEGKTEGSVGGTHLRAGLQLLLDPLDMGDARNLRRMGIEHSYLTLEVQQLNVKDDKTDADLGGRMGSIGLRIEF